MKKTLLLLSAAAMAAGVNAQERFVNNAHSSIGGNSASWTRLHQTAKPGGLAAKNTAGTAPRWYSYPEYFDLHETATSSSVASAIPYLWGTNTVFMNFSSGFDTANLVSYGGVVDPAFAGFSDGTLFTDPTLMKITSTNAYAIDSVEFTGVYLTNPARTSIDTLRVSFVYGDGGTASDIYMVSTTINTGSILTNYGAVGSTIDNYRMHMNTSKLIASGSTVITKDIILNNSTTPPSWAGDTVMGTYIGKVSLGTPGTGISIPAGSMVGFTVSFISGENPPTTPNYDTVFFGSPTNPPVKYNMFRAGVVHRGVSGTPNFPPYSATDRNTGNYVDKTTTTYYVPHWFWSSGSSAASVQYPNFAFHAICPTCATIVTTGGVNEVATVSNANAYPNPATDELNVPFTVTKATDVTVKITNILGQVVATQNMGNVLNGKAVFNTASLPSGVYSYSVTADGATTTGRVAITH